MLIFYSKKLNIKLISIKLIVTTLLFNILLIPYQPVMVELTPLNISSSEHFTECNMPCCKGITCTMGCCKNSSANNSSPNIYLSMSNINSDIFKESLSELKLQESSVHNSIVKFDAAAINTRNKISQSLYPFIKVNLADTLDDKNAHINKQQLTAGCSCEKSFSSFSFKRLDTLLTLVAGVKPPPIFINGLAVSDHQFIILSKFNFLSYPRAPPRLTS